MIFLLVAWAIVAAIIILGERRNRKHAALTAALLPVLLVFALLFVIHAATGWVLARMEEATDWIYERTG